MRTPAALNRLWKEAVNLVIGFQAAGGCAKLSTIVDKNEKPKSGLSRPLGKPSNAL